MAWTLVRRLATAAGSLVVVTVLVFALASWAPGDASESASDMNPITQEQREAIRELYHLDRPPVERYAAWLRDLVDGELGRSFRDRRPVADKVAEAAGTSLLLNSLALGLMVALSVPIGLAAAVRPGSWWDRLALGGTVALYAVPVFWAALALQGLFSVRLGWVPLFGLGDGGANDTVPVRAASLAAHLVLPVACLAYPGLAYLSRFVRANLLESGSAEAARAARARGRSAWSVVWVHGFRQSAVPMLTLVGFLVPRLVGGSILVETIFGIRGVGTLFVESALARDLPVVLGVTLLTGGATLLGILMADLAYVVADPRTRRAV